MAILKCKMCGGDLAIQSGVTVAECEYCGTKQTISCNSDEKRVNLFNQANALRLKCEFDRAANIYESIVAEYPDEAEAYWGLVICDYGIEYVDDPATGKKIPTCHRASYNSVLTDENYLKAIKNADDAARELYSIEALKIDRLCEHILSVCKSEKPYDVFICYKETDIITGDRTVDSDWAEKMYNILTEKGYKVFFSRITLEDKGGMAYEPYIFAALTSAKVMLAVGTKAEHFEAVWVKNEWSRYLKIMRDDKTRYLIPCFNDMAPEDLPREFKGLQAQNIGKVGVEADIVRGIEKIIPKKSQKDLNKTVSGEVTIESLLERAYIFLRDSDYQKANEYFEKVLDRNPHEARAYWGKVLCNERCIDNTELIGERKIREYFERLSDAVEGFDEFIQADNIGGVWGRDFNNAIEFSEGDENTVYAEIFNKMYHAVLPLVQEYNRSVEEHIKKVEAYARRQRKKEKIKFWVKTAAITAAVIFVAVFIYKQAVVKPRQRKAERDARYAQALVDLENGNYQAAYDVFDMYEEDYPDAPAKRLEARAGINKAAIKNCKVGDIVKYGVYEQDGRDNTKDEEIEWKVLAVEDGKVLLIANNVLDAHAYANEDADTIWATSELRRWLNNDFANAAFIDVEKQSILLTDLAAEAPAKNGTLTPAATQDKIFVLSAEEAEKYFETTDSRIAEATEYAMDCGVHTPLLGDNSYWWLRSGDSENQNRAAIINSLGEYSANVEVNDGDYGVRPAIWIDLSTIK